MECPLRREEGSIPYNFCCSSSTQLLSDLRLARPMNIFYSLRFETHRTWWARSSLFYIPKEQGSPVTPSGTGFPFRPLLRIAGVCWRYSQQPWRGEAHTVRNLALVLLKKNFSTDRIENTASDNAVDSCVRISRCGAHRVEHLPLTILLKHVHIRSRDLGCWDSIQTYRAHSSHLHLNRFTYSDNHTNTSQSK